MGTLIKRAVRKQRTEMIKEITDLFEEKDSKSSKPDIIKLNKQIQEIADKLDIYVPQKEHPGFWSVAATPLEETLSINIEKIRRTLDASKSTLSVWNFPHIQNNENNGDSFYDGDALLSHTDFSPHIEALRFNSSGIFVWKKIFREDLSYDPLTQRFLWFVGTIHLVTQQCLFFKRLYSELLEHQHWIKIKIRLEDCENRQLIEPNPSIIFDLAGAYKCKTHEPIQIERDISVSELNINYKDVALGIIKDIFIQFNCTSISDQVIRKHQDNLPHGNL